MYYQNRIVDIVVVGSSCVIFIGVVVVMIQTVVTPLKRQNQELKNIIDDINSGHGDLTKRLTVKSQDEIGQMAQGVNQFIETLQNIIGNMSENVLRDYHTFVDGGKQYRDDALKIDDAMTECAKEAQGILENMVEVKNSIQEINGAVEESAHSSTEAASDMDMLVRSIAAVSEQMKENSTVAGNLKREVKEFYKCLSSCSSGIRLL